MRVIGAAATLALSVAWCAAAAAHPAATPTATSKDEEKVHRLDNIVVTGTRTEYNVEEAPVPVQVITRDEIKAVSAINVAEALDRIPGIYVRQNEQFAMGASTVRMQGADANKVAILRNGRRYRGGIGGVVDLRDIAIEDVERIEVIRGPASSLYGSDAMGGVINIITRHGSENPHYSLTSAGGTFGSFLLQASHGWKIGPLGYFLSYQHDEIAIAQVYGAFSSQFANNSDAKQIRDDVSLQLDYGPSADHRLTLSGDYNPVQEGPLSHRDNATVGADWTWKLGQNWESLLGATWYGFDRKNDLPGFEENARYNDSTGEARALRTIARGWWEESHLITVGNRFRYEDLESKGIERTSTTGGTFTSPDVKASAWLESPYLQDEILLTETISAVTGTSIDVHSNYGASASPRVSVGWRPWRNYRLTAIFGRGYRAPDLLQLYDVDFNATTVTSSGAVQGYVILGNPDLKPETDLAWNLQFDFKPWPWLNGFVTLFRHDFDDLINVELCQAPTCQANIPPPLPPLVFKYQNVSKAVSQGVELTTTVVPSEMPWWVLPNHKLRFDLSYGYLDATDQSGRPGFDGDELPFRPPNRVLPAMTYEYAPLASTVQVWAEYEDRTYADLPNATIVPSYWLWSFKLAGRLDRLLPFIDQNDGLGPALRYLATFVEGQNVTDEQIGIPGPMGAVVGRRTFLAGLQFEL